MKNNKLNRDLDRFMEQRRKKVYLNLEEDNNGETGDSENVVSNNKNEVGEVKEKKRKKIFDKFKKFKEIFKKDESVNEIDGLEVYYDADEGTLKFFKKVKSIFKK